MPIKRSRLEETIEAAQRRWDDCMGEANDDVLEAHRLYDEKMGLRNEKNESGRRYNNHI